MRSEAERGNDREKQMSPRSWRQKAKCDRLSPASEPVGKKNSASALRSRRLCGEYFSEQIHRRVAENAEDARRKPFFRQTPSQALWLIDFLIPQARLRLARGLALYRHPRWLVAPSFQDPSSTAITCPAKTT